MNRKEAWDVLERGGRADLKKLVAALPVADYAVMITHAGGFAKPELSLSPRSEAEAHAAWDAMGGGLPEWKETPRRLAFLWDGKKIEERFYDTERERVSSKNGKAKLTRKPFKPEEAGDAELARALGAVHGLHPIAERMDAGGAATFAFKKGVPWGLFLRLDVAAAFAAGASEASYRLGRREVAAFTLANGVLAASLR